MIQEIWESFICECWETETGAVTNIDPDTDPWIVRSVGIVPGQKPRQKPRHTIIGPACRPLSASVSLSVLGKLVGFGHGLRLRVEMGFCET